MNAPTHFAQPAHPRTLLAIAGLLALTLTACGKKATEAAPLETARPVQAQTVSLGPAFPLIEVSGVGAFRDETRMSFKVGGVVESITVREGDTVKAGQRLAWLNQQEVNAAVSQAAAGLDKAERDLKRGRELRSDEVISKVQLDNLETALQVAKAQAAQANFARKTSDIVANAPGVVLRRMAQVGEVVNVGQPVLVLGSASSGFVVKSSLTDRQAIRVRQGTKATVRFDAEPDTAYTGKVIELSQIADPVTGTYGVQVLLDKAGQQGSGLLSGMQGRVFIEPEGRDAQRTYVPLEAVVEGNNSAAWLFVVQADNSVKRQSVRVAFVDGARIALQEPLPEGTRVVSSGAAYLKDGSKVTVVEQAP